MKLCVKYGVEIMLGSDAHREEDVGDFTRTEKILKEVDFRRTDREPFPFICEKPASGVEREVFMFSVLMRAFSFTLIIIIGIVMKSTGFVPKDAGASVKKFLIYVTLPASIITNFSAIEDMGFNMLIIAALGILLNVIMIAVGALITCRKSKGEQALNMLCLPAFNIGAFCLPFVQSFLPAMGSVTACMFDVGNSIMCTGGTYAFVAEYTAASGSKKELILNPLQNV